MKKYEELEIKISFYFNRDIITNSPGEYADDLGGWNDDWFASKND